MKPFPESALEGVSRDTSLFSISFNASRASSVGPGRRSRDNPHYLQIGKRKRLPFSAEPMRCVLGNIWRPPGAEAASPPRRPGYGATSSAPGAGAASSAPGAGARRSKATASRRRKPRGGGARLVASAGAFVAALGIFALGKLAVNKLSRPKRGKRTTIKPPPKRL